MLVDHCGLSNILPIKPSYGDRCKPEKNRTLINPDNTIVARISSLSFNHAQLNIYDSNADFANSSAIDENKIDWADLTEGFEHLICKFSRHTEKKILYFHFCLQEKCCKAIPANIYDKYEWHS